MTIVIIEVNVFEILIVIVTIVIIEVNVFKILTDQLSRGQPLSIKAIGNCQSENTLGKELDL